MDYNIVVYDGDCGFCNFWVQWILKVDKLDKFHFASLQSNFGQDFLKKNKLPTENFDTVYVIKNGTYYSKLNAIAEVGLTLRGIYYILGIIKIIPNYISDYFYMIISKNRKRLMTESCLLPTIEEREKFLI